eukprot:2546521-Amphidinium_carterae.2
MVAVTAWHGWHSWDVKQSQKGIENGLAHQQAAATSYLHGAAWFLVKHLKCAPKPLQSTGSGDSRYGLGGNKPDNTA